MRTTEFVCESSELAVLCRLYAWVLLNEAIEAGWGLAGHANTT